jgi:hypothetical protein
MGVGSGKTVETILDFECNFDPTASNKVNEMNVVDF